METSMAVFRGKGIRKTIHNKEWWFAIADVVEALTDSTDPRQYIKKMRKRDSELNSYWGTICTPLRLKALDGKMRKKKLRQHRKSIGVKSSFFTLTAGSVKNEDLTPLFFSLAKYIFLKLTALGPTLILTDNRTG